MFLVSMANGGVRIMNSVAGALHHHQKIKDTAAHETQREHCPHQTGRWECHSLHSQRDSPAGLVSNEVQHGYFNVSGRVLCPDRKPTTTTHYSMKPRSTVESRRRAISTDISVLKQSTRALNKSSSRRILKANLEFLWDRYITNPYRLPKHLQPNP